MFNSTEKNKIALQTVIIIAIVVFVVYMLFFNNNSEENFTDPGSESVNALESNVIVDSSEDYPLLQDDLQGVVAVMDNDISGNASSCEDWGVSVSDI